MADCRPHRRNGQNDTWMGSGWTSDSYMLLFCLFLPLSATLVLGRHRSIATSSTPTHPVT